MKEKERIVSAVIKEFKLEKSENKPPSENIQ
jgi:hypothetical protein